MVVDPADLPVLGLGRPAENGKGHVRLQGHQPPVQIREADDAVAHQKILVAGVEVIFLKTAHAEAAVALGSVKPPELQRRPLGIAEDAIVNLHRLRSFPVLFGSRPRRSSGSG